MYYKEVINKKVETLADTFNLVMSKPAPYPKPSSYHLPYIGKVDRKEFIKYQKVVKKYMKGKRLIDMDENAEREIAKLYNQTICQI